MPRPHSHGRGGPRICCRASRKKSADLVEVKRPNDQRERYLSIEELRRLEAALDTKMYRQGTRAINQTFYRLRLLVLISLTTGMRMSEIFALTWSDVLYREGLIAVRSKLKGGKIGTSR
jgi:integrase